MSGFWSSVGWQNISSETDIWAIEGIEAANDKAAIMYLLRFILMLGSDFYDANLIKIIQLSKSNAGIRDDL